MCALEQVWQLPEGAQALEFRRSEDGEGRYAWIEAVLRRPDYQRVYHSSPTGHHAGVDIRETVYRRLGATKWIHAIGKALGPQVVVDNHDATGSQQTKTQNSIAKNVWRLMRAV